MSLLNIGMSGLAAGQSSLMTTGNNIANVDTAGYSRQQTVQGTKASQHFGNVYIGTGTTVREDVPAGALAVSAGKQRNIADWVARKQKKE